MGRHEIRFRRQRMTSRRIERHKNYQDILDQHKSRRRTRLVRLIIYILAFLVLFLAIIYGMGKIIQPDNQSPEKEVHSVVSPNFTGYDFSKKPQT